MGEDSASIPNEKAVRLVEYLLRLASLRTKLIRDISEYEKILWISDVPRQKGCFAMAWGTEEDYESDIWVEIQHWREPELPSVPNQCKDWIIENSLHSKNDLPELLTQISIEVRNPSWTEGSDQPEHIEQQLSLGNHPEIQKAWDRYVDERWLSWVEQHNDWESVHKAYSTLFAIHQEQLRLGEEYELIIGLGLLTWQTPNGQRVRRHLVVVNAMLEFEARLGKFTVRPNIDGAKVRPELDMLDIEEQPARVEDNAKIELNEAADNPWEKDCIDNVLKAIVKSISAEGEYNDLLESKNDRATAKPIVEYAPAIILRKRSIRGLTETLKRIKENIENGEQIPPEFADLAEIRLKNIFESESDPGNSRANFEGEIYFPKPSNEEQRRIVDKIRSSNGVLVQGPPGTGKSHTIANLICHFLATGQRMLITAKTPRALQVLEGLVPEELRPLCINLLGRGSEEKRSLELSINGILKERENWNEELTAAKLKILNKSLIQLREEKNTIDRRLREIRESETHFLTIAQGKYKGTAAQIAQTLQIESKDFGWFRDEVPLDQSCPFGENDLLNILRFLRNITPEKRLELKLALPGELKPPDNFGALVTQEKYAIEEINREARGADENLAHFLSKTGGDYIQELLNSCSVLQNQRKRILTSAHSWAEGALHDILSGNSTLWRAHFRLTSAMINAIEPIVYIADNNSLNNLDETDIKSLLDDALILKEHIEAGGKLGWWLIRPKLVRDRLYVLKTIRLNGHFCRKLDDFENLIRVLMVRNEIEKAWDFWSNYCEKMDGPYVLQFNALKAINDELNSILSIEKTIEQCRNILRKCTHLTEPNWTDKSEIEQIIASCRLAQARLNKSIIDVNIMETEKQLRILITRGKTHPIVNDIIKSIQDRNIDEYDRCFIKYNDLKKQKTIVSEMDENLISLGQLTPKLKHEMVNNYAEPHWESRIRQIENSWAWALAKKYIESYLNKDDVPNLVKRYRQIESGISENIELTAAFQAWRYFYSRLNEEHMRHLEAWSKHMKSQTQSGRGKRDFRNRRAAQRSLEKCRDAVPAWVMPLHRVWDTIDPLPAMFDVIIVDEASQCGFEALPLLYLGKKILVVGDDKQISPGGEFQEVSPIDKAMNQYLNDFDFKEYFDLNVSLFDHAKLRYGANRIVLREHFRCMPEIIRFSNDLCYSDTPLIPLRQYGPNRLPPLQSIFIEGGYREGKDSHAINKLEAIAVVDKIAELCRDRKYDGKTMGVIALQGDAQARLIEGMLLDRIGAIEMEKRRLISGNPYSFQGDERDVIFLSMVVGPDAASGLIKEGPTDEKRYNVAASRARDQMWLFHSVKPEDLSSARLRKRLLEYFWEPKLPEFERLDREALERRAEHDNRLIVKPPAPFDSWFEVDVALELLRRDFQVTPQFKIAGKTIDLVIEGGYQRLAVECDGDYWHGAEQYEADMQRQRILERCGLEFYRIRESAFRFDKEIALLGLLRRLEERDIFPGAVVTLVMQEEHEDDSADISDIGNMAFEDESPEALSLFRNLNSDEGQSHQRIDEITASDIQNAIIDSLHKCPNRTCTLKSMTSRVLKELQIITRGNPRSEFEKRVMRNLSILEDKEVIERYKAKNRRIRLL